MTGQELFDKYMDDIKKFLENTPEDIYEFSIDMEDRLVFEYDAMREAQPEAIDILEEEVPDICATGEPGMSPQEIEEFKQKLRVEYEKALKAVTRKIK